MDATILSRLDQLIAKHAELADQLGLPETLSDQARFRELSKAYADLQETVTTYTRFKKAQAEFDGARELAVGGDPEMAEMGREEAARLEPELEKLEKALKLCLLPSDPNDAKNAILEIRAGTGGEEAALFAGDLFRMYARYAERKGWKMEVMDENRHGAGRLQGDHRLPFGPEGSTRGSSTRAAYTASSASPPPRRRGASTPRP